MFVSIPVRCNSNWWSSKAAKAGLSFNSSKVQFELSRVSARILVFFGFNSSKVQFERRIVNPLWAPAICFNSSKVQFELSVVILRNPVLKVSIPVRCNSNHQDSGAEGVAAVPFQFQ